ncbi:MAG: hypothetical protein QNJ60_12880 [Xenococcaceae cyanobacterium MO_188.B19]|nr:hypothetical protein [Xenococcaceae cyanobacterium MO_188.B19]
MSNWNKSDRLFFLSSSIFVVSLIGSDLILRNIYSPGVVTRLVQDGEISQYLKPSATRHTFITIQAHAGVDLTHIQQPHR